MWSNKRPISTKLTWTQTEREGRQSRGAQKTEDLPEQEQERAVRLITEEACLTHSRRKRNSKVKSDRRKEGGGGWRDKTKHKKAQRQKINTIQRERESACVRYSERRTSRQREVDRKEITGV